MPNTFTLIASATAGSGGTASFNFTSIPSTYTDLVVKASIRGEYADNWMDCYLRFNGSSTSYSDRVLYGTGSAAASLSESAAGINFRVDGSVPTANTFASIDAYIPNYLSSNYKSVSADVVTENNGTAAIAQLVAGLWSNTAAINQVTLFPNSGSWVQYSTAYLYGIKNS
jgi:hypothetical protein